MGEMAKREYNRFSLVVITTRLLIFLVLVGCVRKVAGSESREIMLGSDDNVFSTDQNEDGAVVQNLTLEMRALQKELTMLADVVRRLVKQNENELAVMAPIKARYFRDPQENTQLHLAAQKGDEQAVIDLIHLGADINARNKNSETPIIQAAESNVDANASLKIIKYLVESGADVLAVDREGQTFLHKFASRESPPTPTQFHYIADYLVGRNLSNLFSHRDEVNWSTPLMLAAVNINIEPMTLALLHANGVHFTLHDKNGKSVLSYATEGNNSELITSLLNLGTFNLDEAVMNPDEVMVKLLVRFGADVNKTSVNPVKSPFGQMGSYSGTPLLFAADLWNKSLAIDIIKFLINSEADAYAKDENNETFLHKLIRYRNNDYGIDPIRKKQFEDVAAFLISKDVSQVFNTLGILHANSDYAPTVTNSTPFQLAVRSWDMDTATLTLLKENGVDFNFLDSGGCSVICLATSGDRTLRFISDLVDLGANIMSRDTTNTSMLHRAAKKGKAELVKFFLDKGLDVNAQDNDGNTALHMVMSSFRNAFETVQILMRNGANREITNNSGNSPLQHLNSMRSWVPQRNEISNCLSLGSSC